MGKMGLLTIVDDDVIEIEYIVDWFLKAREKYGLEKVIADNYRTDIVRRAFEDAGIKLEVLRNQKQYMDYLHHVSIQCLRNIT